MNPDTPPTPSRRAPRQPKNPRRRVRSESDRKKHAGWRRCPRCNRSVSTNGRNFYHHMHKCDRVFFADLIAKVDTARAPVSTPLPPPTPSPCDSLSVASPSERNHNPVRMSEMQKVVFLQQLCFLRVYDRTVDTVLKQLEASHVSLFSTTIFEAVRRAKDADANSKSSPFPPISPPPLNIKDLPPLTVPSIQHPQPSQLSSLPSPLIDHIPVSANPSHLSSSYNLPTSIVRSSPSPTSVNMSIPMSTSVPGIQSFPTEQSPHPLTPGTPMSITNSHPPNHLSPRNTMLPMSQPLSSLSPGISPAISLSNPLPPPIPSVSHLSHQSHQSHQTHQTHQSHPTPNLEIPPAPLNIHSSSLPPTHPISDIYTDTWRHNPPYTNGRASSSSAIYTSPPVTGTPPPVSKVASAMSISSVINS